MEAQMEFCPTGAIGNTEDFFRYPAHKVLSVFDKAEDVKAAIEELKKEKFSDDEIDVFCGQNGEKRIDFSGEEHGFWSTFVRSIQNLSAERIYLENYKKELHEGHFLLMVQAEKAEKRERAVKILQANKGHRLTYFGTWLIEGIPENKTEKFNAHPYGYRRELETSFDETLEKTRQALKNAGFGVLTEIDMKKTLKEKLDVDFRNYVILGACNPPLAHQALQEDLDIGLLLPCNVVVYESNDGAVVAAIDAKKMMSVAGNPNLETTAETVNEKLRSAIENL